MSEFMYLHIYYIHLHNYTKVCGIVIVLMLHNNTSGASLVSMSLPALCDTTIMVMVIIFCQDLPGWLDLFIKAPLSL